MSFTTDNVSSLSTVPALPNLKRFSIWIRFNASEALRVSVRDLPEFPLLEELRVEQPANVIGLDRYVNLKDLRLEDGSITDITPLGSLLNIEILDLDNNQISDVTPLSNLSSLRSLSLRKNKIDDISSLANSTNLTNLLGLDLRSNLLNLSPNSDDMQNIQILIDKGIGVQYQ